MNSIRITPFYLCIVLYFFSNFIFALTAIKDQQMFIEMNYFTVSAPLMLGAFFLQTFSLLVLILVYISFSKRNFKTIVDNGYGNLAGKFLIFYQLFYLLLVIFFGVGVVNGDVSNVSTIIIILTNILSADILFFIIGSQLKSNKYFILNLILYLFSSIIRGWMGGFLISIFIYLCRKKYVYLKLSSLFFYVIIIVLILLASPFLIDLKFSIRAGDSFDFSWLDYSDRLLTSIDYLFSRFQHVGHIYLIIKDSWIYSNAYEVGLIKSYLIEGLPQGIIYSRLGNSIGLEFGQYFAKNAFAGFGWNANPGLAGWLYILREKSLFFMTYWMIIILSTYFLILKKATYELFLVFSIFLITYFFHGWLGSFFNLILMIWFFTIINKLRITN